MTDPRHPLYGKTLPLISVEQRRDAGLCCVVDEHGINTRYIPVKATDKSPVAVTTSTIPLSLKAVQQLLTRISELWKAIRMKVSHPYPTMEPARKVTAPEKQLLPHQIWLNLTPQQQQAVSRELENTCRTLIHIQNSTAEVPHDCR